MDATVQIRDRGVITLPAELRRKHNIQVGDSFRVVDRDGVFVLIPMTSMVPELAYEIEKARLEAGLSIEELLEGLRQQREQYYHETYESAQTS